MPDKLTVPLTVKDTAAQNIVYDGNEHPLDTANFDTGDIPAEIAFSCPERGMPENVGSYIVIVTATPTDTEFSATKIEVTVTIAKATVPEPNRSFSGLEGTALSDLNDLPETIKVWTTRT